MRAKRQATLLELVQAVAEFASTDEEIVATVAHMINSGQVRLCGNFAGARIELSPLPRPAIRRASVYPPR
jgi:hypothetical protein